MANGLAGLLGAIGTGVDALGGGVPSVYGGLLSEDELRAAKSRAQQDALAKMASALYAAGAPSRTPGGGTGQAIAQALQAGREGYQGALSGQLQEKMNQQKIQQALAAQKRQADVNQLIQGAFQQAQPGQRASMIGGAPYGADVPATPAKFDLQAIAPQLMQTAEGRQALQSLQGMMKPEMFSVAEGATQYARDPLTGQVRVVGSGAEKLTTDQRNYMAAKAGGFAGTFSDYMDKFGKKGTTISLGGDKALADTVGKDIGSMIGEATQQARVAMETISNAQNIESALDKAITGPAADARTTWLRIGQSLGVAGKDANDILANTQILVQGLAKAELQAAEAMKGQGQITENERLIIKRASAGTQNMSPPEIRASLIAIRKVAENKIKRHGDLLQQFKKLPNVQQYVPFYELPTYQQPVGATNQDPFQKALDEEAKKRGL